MSSASNPNPAIVIPTYKAIPLPEERISLTQCQKILGSRDIYLLTPEGLNIDAYQQIFPNLKFINVAPALMANHQAYNRLMISPLIFYTLKSHSHILIYEPDAIVIKDDLDFWCQQGFDYIGAPWFKKDNSDALTLSAAGNFGFSLINTKSVNAIFRSDMRWYSAAMIIRDIFRGVRGKKGSIARALKALGSAGKISGASELFDEHCDIFWSFTVPGVVSKFKVAPPMMAILFSWETYPEKCSELNGNKLPFGMHAWAKHNPTFVKQLIQMQDSR